MEKFLEGELVDLYIPDLDFIRSSTTFEWWNDLKVTKFLESGIKKNTLQKQEAYYQNTKDLVFFFSDKENIIGTVMISSLDRHRKCGDLGIVRGDFKNKKPLQSIEAIAHLMHYAFQTLNLERIFARHHIGHIPFSHRLSLLGFQLEGIFTNDFIKEDWSEVSDRIHTVCHRKTYEKIISIRGGGIWDNQAKMLKRLKHLPKEPFHHQLLSFLKSYSEHYHKIFTL